MKSLLTRSCLVLGASLLTLASGIGTAVAAPAKKPSPAKKPLAAKPKLIREVMGTNALTGYEGVPGLTYTLGKEAPMNFTLRKVEYTVSRVNIDGYSYFPTGDEKYMIVHYIVQNPRKTAFNMSSSYLTLSAVDSSGVSRATKGNIAREVTNESLSYTLQPGQKVDVFSIIPVAAFGAVPKLLVQATYEKEAPIIRYNLAGKVAKLPAPFGDAQGVTAVKMIPSKVGVFYPVAEYFDVRVDSASYEADKVGGYEAGEGKQYYVAKVTIKNRASRSVALSSSFFRAELKDVDGEKTRYNGVLLKGSRDENVDAQLQPGEEVKARFFWPIPTGVKAQTVLLGYGYDAEGRSYAVDVTGLAKAAN